MKMKTTEQIIADLPTMNIGQIAGVIKQDWGKVNFAAMPYLSAMFSLYTVDDRYGADDGRSIVAYFLSNARSYKGDLAKAIKAELNKRCKQ